MDCQPESWDVMQAAEFLRVAPESLLFLNEIGSGPPANGIGWHIEYVPDQVRRWLWESGMPAAAPTRKYRSSTKGDTGDR